MKDSGLGDGRLVLKASSPKVKSERASCGRCGQTALRARFLSQQLLQEAQVYPGGKLLLSNWVTVDLKHVCCSLTVVKHWIKREETALVARGLPGEAPCMLGNAS